MKKECVKPWIRLMAATCISVFALSSCSPVFGNFDVNRNNTGKSVHIQTIASKVYQLKSEGVFDGLEDVSRSAIGLEEDGLTDEDFVELNSFISSPNSYLESRLDETVDEKELDLLYTIYSDATVGEVIQKMDAVSTEMAEEYETKISELYENLDDDARSAVGGYKNIRLNLSLTDFDECRSSDKKSSFSWGSVAGYVGFAATATAGMAISKVFWWCPWVKYPALAVGIAGIVGMGVLIGVWISGSEFALFKNVVVETVQLATKIMNDYKNLSDADLRNKFLEEMSESLKSYLQSDPTNANNYKEILKWIDSQYLGIISFSDAMEKMIEFGLKDNEFGAKLSVASVSTFCVTVTCLACYGNAVVSFVSSAWNKILGWIPSWLSIGFPNSISIDIIGLIGSIM